MDLLELETSIKQLPGVLGCAIFSGPDGEPRDVQAFTDAGTDPARVERAIAREMESRGIGTSEVHIFVSDTEPASSFEEVARGLALEDSEGIEEDDPVAALERRLAPRPGRPAIQTVALTSTAAGVEAEVVLEGMAPGERGRARGEKTTRGLDVVARAALEAVHQLEGVRRFHLEHASVVSTEAGEAVLVFVGAGRDRFVGTALVRNEPLAEVAARATLGAINRRIGRVD